MERNGERRKELSSSHTYSRVRHLEQVENRRSVVGDGHILQNDERGRRETRE